MPIKLAADTRNKRGGDEHRAEHQGNGDDRTGDFRHGLERRLTRRQAFGHPALDILDYDNGVVHDDAKSQYQPKQREMIQRKAEGCHDAKSPNERHWHIDHGEERRPPVLEKNEHHHEHEGKGFEERMGDRIDRFPYKHRRVIHNTVFQPFRKAFAEFGHGLADTVRCGQGIGARALQHGNRHGLFTIEIAIGRVITRPQLDAGDITQARHAATAAGFDDDVPELFGLQETPLGRHGQLQRVARGRRRLPDDARCHLDVLLTQGLYYITGRHIE